MLIASIKVNDTLSVNVANIHYIPKSPLLYEQQIGRTKNNIEMPAILCGDFNGYPAESFLDIGLVDSDSTNIFGIDRIYYSLSHFDCYYTLSYFDTVSWTSDHPYNLAELTIRR